MASGFINFMVKFSLDIKKKFFVERLVRHCSRLTKEAVLSILMYFLKKHVDRGCSLVVYLGHLG